MQHYIALFTVMAMAVAMVVYHFIIPALLVVLVALEPVTK